MPLIGPPPNVEHITVEPVRVSESSKQESARIERYLDVPNWTCYMSDCGAVNFGRNKKCAYCWGRKGRFTERPINYMEPPL